MKISVETRTLSNTAADLLAVPISEFDPARWRLPPRIAALDRDLSGRISSALGSGDFRGKTGQTLLLYGEEPVRAARILLLGLGAEAETDAETLRRVAAAAVSQAASRRAKHVAIACPPHRRVRFPAASQSLAEGAVLGAYRFDTYRGSDEDAPGGVESVALVIERAADARAARAGAKTGVVLAESQNIARDLSNEPPNELPPIALASAAERVAKEVGLRCRVLDVPEMKRRKMGGILAVGGGSVHPPRVVVLEHNAPPGRGRKRAGAAGRNRPTVCLVGKGITFDSGGISIKPAASMDEMKHDMSGAAAVVGAMRAVALLNLPLHVVGVIGAAENLPSGTAYRPGDIVRSMSGKTIEILNTDAEGRVVLADALHFARTEFEPQAMIDLATLTGACVIALGKWATGAFANNERLAEVVRRAGETTSERAWPMPLWEEHRKHVKSQVADVKNAAGRDASASTAAAFLSHFVGDTPWVHLDIAGTAWTTSRAGYQPRGATGVGVRLLVEILRGWKDHRIV